MVRTVLALSKLLMEMEMQVASYHESTELNEFLKARERQCAYKKFIVNQHAASDAGKYFPFTQADPFFS